MFGRSKAVEDTAAPVELPPLNRDDFDKALVDFGARTWYIWWLFLLCCSSCIVNGFHVMSYVFFSETPEHWCKIPVLEEANWTPEQIRAVSSPDPTAESNCEYYNWNYNELRGMGYERALAKVKTDPKPQTIACENFHYKEEYLDSTFVPEWNMVCGRLAMKATVQTAVCFGKFGGSFFFGVFGDKYGRKTTFILGGIIYMMSGLVISWTRLYIVMLICRVGIGVAGIGVYQGAYGSLVEIVPIHLRATLGVMFNQSYAVGMILIAIIAYFVRPWRTLQTIICIPSYFLIIQMLMLPESPRWAYYSGRPIYAWDIVKNYLPPEKKQLLTERKISTIPQVREKTDFKTKLQRFNTKTKAQLAYLKNSEVATRLFLCCAIWFSTALSYYALSITSGHLKIDRYLYTGLSGIVEGVSYFVVVPMLNLMGRRGSTTCLLFSAGVAFVINLFLPDYLRNTKMIFALFGRLCISSVYVVVIIHTSELFPTVMRNTAIGTSSAWSHIGSTLAPYIVDYFVIYGWWVPNVICGSTAFISALFAQFLPETKGLALYNTMQEFLDKCAANPEERISLKHCMFFKMYKRRQALAAEQPQTS